MKTRLHPILLLIALLFLPISAFPHSGGTDGQGGHHNRKEGTYHFHRGPLAGKTYTSKSDATQTLQASSSSTHTTATVPTPSAETTNPTPAVDLAPYQPTAPDCEIVVHRAYTLCYNEAHEQASWVLYRITEGDLAPSVKRTNNFRSDPAVSMGSATLRDYKKSGYDRGHLAPAGAMVRSEGAMTESFYLSNMSPQVPGFNRGIWKKLETQVRSWARKHEELYVVTGPVLRTGLPTIGPSGVSVPEHYYKVVLDLREPGIRAMAFVLPNEKTKASLATFTLPVDSIEQRTGIDFFPIVPDSLEGQIEATSSYQAW
jgi:endonuclease G, mitochondrial